MKIKVLITLGSLAIGGNEVFVLNLINNIDYKKFDVDVLVYSKVGFNESLADRIKELGCHIIINTDKKKSKYIDFINDVLFTIKTLKRENYSIIHCNSCSLIGLIKGICSGKKSKKVKIISHSHNSGMEKNTFFDSLIRKQLKKYISRNVDYGFSCSDLAGKSKYTDAFIKSERYVLINNAIDIDKYSFNRVTRNQLRCELNISSDTVVVGCIGRLNYQKNQQYLLKIIAGLKKKNSNIKLVLIGTGEDEGDLRLLARTLQIEDNILWLGNRLDAFKFYNIMDVFVLTSRFEGLPFVLIEAQVNGLPCVVSDAISKNVNVSNTVDFISINGSVDSWVSVIQKRALNRLSEEEIRKVSNKYNIDYEIKRIEKIYYMLATSEK